MFRLLQDAAAVAVPQLCVGAGGSRKKEVLTLVTPGLFRLGLRRPICPGGNGEKQELKAPISLASLD